MGIIEDININQQLINADADADCKQAADAAADREARIDALLAINETAIAAYTAANPPIKIGG